MKLKKICEYPPIWIPEAETAEEEMQLAAQNLMKQYYLGTNNIMYEYDPITQETKIISPFNS